MAKKDHRFIVYRAENTINGKQYIGYTSRGLACRRSQHIRKATRKENGAPRLGAAIRKYGEESFTWEVVASFDTADEALAFEVFVIKRDRPAYNVSAGGTGPSLPAYNKLQVLCLNDGTRYDSLEAASAYYGTYRPEKVTVVDFVYQSGGRYFLALPGNPSELERKEIIKICDEAKVEARRKVDVVAVEQPMINGKDRLGRSSAGPAKNARPVLCVTDGRTYPSASAAAFEYKISKSAIIEVCLNKKHRQTANGKKFEYVKVN